MSGKTSWITKELDKLKTEGLLINLRTIEGAVGSKIVVNGKRLLNLCTNNYLGLANDSRLKKAAKNAIDKFGVGPTAVRSIAGTTSLHQKLETKLAEFKKAEEVVTFQSGFNANIAAVPALVGESDVIFSDELNHASIIDACRLSKATVIRYKHLDTNDLETQIKNQKLKTFGKKLIITDGVFSMNGDIAPLPEIVKIANKYNCLLAVDDAHGEGVLGTKGRGIVDHFNLHGKVDVEIGTLSKAFGVVGGLVAGKTEIITWLRQKSRPFLFSSAMTAADVGACIKAVEILETSDRLVKKLWSNTKYFKEKLSNLGFDTGKSQTPIIPLMLGDAKLAQNFSKELFENGIFAMAITYPTVAKGEARIRVMMSASHSKSDLNMAIEIFEHVGKKMKVI